MLDMSPRADAAVGVIIILALFLANPILGGPATTNLTENATELEREIHEVVNEKRAQNGLGELDWDPELAAIARNHSQDMAERGYFSHINPDGETPTRRYHEAGYNCRTPVNRSVTLVGAGENIFVYRDPQYGELGGDVLIGKSMDEIANEIVQGWDNSSGHRENLRFEHYRSEGIGVAAVENEDTVFVYVTQNFC